MTLFALNTNTSVKPTPPSLSTTQVPVIDTASYYTSTVASQNIIGYLDGAPWTVTYYAQYLGKDDPVINANDVSSPTLRQYLKIFSFELRVTTQLTGVTDPGSGTTVVTGGSNVYPVITPMVGDIFIGLIAVGSYGVFQITAFTRSSFYKSSAWDIEYSQIGFANTDQVYTALDQYVVNTLIFDASQLGTGNNPLSTITEYNQTINKDELISGLIESYYVQFFDNTTKTFLVPNGNTSYSFIYDPYVVGFWNTVVDDNQFIDYVAPIAYDIRTGLITSPYKTIFDAVLNQSLVTFNNCIKATQMVSTAMFDVAYLRHTLMISGLNMVVYPYTNLQAADNTYGSTSSPYTTYIFSSAFYQGLTGQSALEAQVTKLLNKQAILFSDIAALVTSVSTLSLTEQFYQIPFLIVLLRVAR